MKKLLTLLLSMTALTCSYAQDNFVLSSFGTKDSSIIKYSHSLWIQSVFDGNVDATIQNTKDFNTKYLAHDPLSGDFYHIDLPDSTENLEDMCLAIGSKNRAFLVEIKNIYPILDKEKTYVIEFYDKFRKQEGTLVIENGKPWVKYENKLLQLNEYLNLLP